MSEHDQPIARRRGYGLRDLSNASIAYLLAKAPADAVADALAAALGGTVTRDALGAAVTSRQSVSVWQLAGHDWSGFASALGPAEQRAAGLSRALGCDVLAFCNEDVSGWNQVQLFRGGVEVEHVQWGLDYSDEIEGAAEETGEPAPDRSEWYAKWDVRVKVACNESMMDEYLFRSALRKVDADDLRRGEAFVDDLFRRYDAYLPDLHEMPWADGPDGVLRSENLPGNAFARVHRVTKDG
ncbi:MAG: hypothetical protein AVDCRST_MAG64-1046 [uncultured Phycisphaerae bacterium]|uniref:Uncharacterized protein n=1 Tax=uncultured Phycisphaerae bacterium TaxID=904963 RepID=A0A6J4NM89_9BACT|nr:MAG: hypothetical protein AVDCRST_MAG64-1046 [uncultured Phycisphaerae bacterium]